MRIVFFGTPEFAVASLAALLDAGFNVVAAVTAPDKPAGRGRQLQQSAVKQFAAAKKIPVLQPQRLKDPAFFEELKALKPDLQIVVAFRMLPEQVWSLPEHGTYNLHASLLPRYRGAAPINWAIINGDTETGVTTFRLRHEIDSGSILFQEKVTILPEDDAGSLHDKLMRTGAQLLVKTVDEIRNAQLADRPLKFIEQDLSKVTHAPKIFREHCRVDWQETAEKIHNLVRGLSPHPAAYTELVLPGKRAGLKLYRTQVSDDSAAGEAGRIKSDNRNYITVQCGSGNLDILELQPEGKKRMQISEFLNGTKVSEAAFE